jgi:hypothetical protein
LTSADSDSWELSDAVKGDRTNEQNLDYEIQQSVDPITASSWTHAEVVTGSKAMLTGLTSGAKMWFRVRSVGPKKIKGPWSDPAFKVVP